MSEKLMKHKTLIIIIAAIIIAAIGFGAGLAIKNVMAKNDTVNISAEKAKSIALSNAGVSESNATFTKVELDRDDNRPNYDIEFFTSTNEYDFDINADTGEVQDKSSESIAAQAKDNDNNVIAETGAAQASNAKDNGSYIGTNKAKQVALEHAGVAAGSASFEKVELDAEHGTNVYEVEFVSGNKEYDYEINATTGKIIEYDIGNNNH